MKELAELQEAYKRERNIVAKGLYVKALESFSRKKDVDRDSIPEEVALQFKKKAARKANERILLENPSIIESIIEELSNKYPDYNFKIDAVYDGVTAKPTFNVTIKETSNKTPKVEKKTNKSSEIKETEDIAATDEVGKFMQYIGNEFSNLMQTMKKDIISAQKKKSTLKNKVRLDVLQKDASHIKIGPKELKKSKSLSVNIGNINYSGGSLGGGEETFDINKASPEYMQKYWDALGKWEARVAEDKARLSGVLKGVSLQNRFIKGGEPDYTEEVLRVVLDLNEATKKNIDKRIQESSDPQKAAIKYKKKFANTITVHCSKKAFFETFSAEELNMLKDLTEEGYLKWRRKLESLENKFRKQAEQFAKVYTTDDGTTPFYSKKTKSKTVPVDVWVTMTENVKGEDTEVDYKRFRYGNKKIVNYTDAKGEKQSVETREIIIKKDRELYSTFQKELKKFDNDFEALMNYYKNSSEKSAEHILDDLKKIESGLYVMKKGYNNKPYEYVLAETEEEKAEAKKAQREFLRHKRLLLTATFGGLAYKTLKEEVAAEYKKANEIYNDYVAKIKKECKSVPQLPPSLKLDIDKIADQRYATNVEKYLSKILEKRLSTRKVISATSANRVKGMENLFKPAQGVVNFSFEDQESSSSQGVVLGAGLKAPTTTSAVVVRKSSLLPIPIPVDIVKEKLIKENYGATVAATFFQLLVSNTPMDEDYTATYTYTYYTKKKVAKTEVVKDAYGEVEISRDAEDMAEEMINSLEKKERTVTRKHVADNDVVRNDWKFNYKNVIFTPLDSEFNGKGLFDKAGDLRAIHEIALVFIRRTANSRIRTQNFTYTNTNKRWEMLEYGGYSSKNSGPFRGAKYQHGVKDGYSWQAPNGYLRLIETYWNHIIESGSVFNSLADSLNMLTVDVKDINKKMLEICKKREKTIGTRMYDYNNFVYVEEL